MPPVVAQLTHYSIISCDPNEGCHVSEVIFGETNVTFVVTSPKQRLVTRHNGTRQRMRIQSNMRHYAALVHGCG